MEYCIVTGNNGLTFYKVNGGWSPDINVFWENPWETFVIGEDWKRMVREQKNMRDEVNWRVIHTDSLPLIHARHAITGRDYVSIIDKHNLDIWE